MPRIPNSRAPSSYPTYQSLDFILISTPALLPVTLSQWGSLRHHHIRVFPQTSSLIPFWVPKR